MRTFCVKNGLVVGVILLFIGVAFQPVIIADVSNNSEDSDLLEITVEIYELNRVQGYTVMLTQEQAEELELLINNTKAELDAVDNLDETETIFKETVLSLNELGLITNGMNVEKVQRLVTGEEQNSRIVKLLEKYNSKNQKSLDKNENTLCLISGDTINTIFAGSIPILILLRFFVFTARINMFFGWLSNFPELWDRLSPYLDKIVEIFFSPRFSFWLFLGASINFLPIKFGAFIYYGWLTISFDPWYPSELIPAEGWVFTIGLSGKQQWIGDFFGHVVGFTGIKIIRGFLDFFYLGAALQVKIEED